MTPTTITNKVLHVDTTLSHLNTTTTVVKATNLHQTTQVTCHPITMSLRGYYTFILSVFYTLCQVVFHTLTEEVFSMFNTGELNAMILDEGVEWSNLIPNTPSYEKLGAIAESKTETKSPRKRQLLDFSQHKYYEFKYPDGI
ncbi:hypothetical protein FDP41_000703 [Naegleria fowleri]|uniref:Uncharacterized protein n=1 Tax=Naegleria fowleri TaxID=5763 RepID=A0A6A5CDZ1_NAEFO|nr:uncharacterized protein FDP41_000703 [Naegleria fowleri]KAF0984804.1 hypothetical protein FDP41_000703 [Naegleria fowleri]CAG4717228.1 unnamed protein product [Naegleria fowleri]